MEHAPEHGLTGQAKHPQAPQNVAPRQDVLGLDIGGANIKVAHSDGRAWSTPFALWKAPQELGHQLATIVLEAGRFDVMAVTMTAELCDCFAIKREGVNRVLDAAQQVAQDKPVYVWQTDGRFVSPAEARSDPMLCAAANWHALATVMARAYPQGLTLMVDTGSTTTDIIKLEDGRAHPVGVTDRQRLATGELVYLGARRTPLMALGPKVMFHGRLHGVMAENFATMADVRLLLGELPEDETDVDTPDGRGMNMRWASARLVRMIGADLEAMSFDDVMELAVGFASIAQERLAGAISQVLGGRRPARVVVSGSGADMAQAAAEKALPGVEILSWAQQVGDAASQAACAHALVTLVNTQGIDAR